MKRTALELPLIVILLFVAVIGAQPITKANPMYTSIPPKVTVPEMNVNAIISKVDDLFWVKIDAEYQMHTIYGYGDSYLAQNTGMGLIADPVALCRRHCYSRHFGSSLSNSFQSLFNTFCGASPKS